jgi:protein gp37
VGERSNIEWTESSWTPVRARAKATGKVGWHCEHASPGCINCYAEGMNKRLGTGLPFKPDQLGAVEMFLDADMLRAPLRWRRPRKIFVCSMTDLFADFVPDEWIDQVFAVMALCPQHTFQVLTKRADRMRTYFGARRSGDPWAAAADHVADLIGKEEHPRILEPRDIPLPNVWLGVSMEDQRRADERIPHLLDTPAAVRFLSCEPLLGPVDIASAMTTDAALSVLFEKHACAGSVDPRGSLHWVICGGESGPGARPMHPDWARGLRDQCAAAGIPFFLKQWGEWAPADDQHGQATFSAVHATTGMSRTSVSVGMTFIEDGGPYAGMRRIGKKAAGATLDGREWRRMPGDRGDG